MWALRPTSPRPHLFCEKTHNKRHPSESAGSSPETGTVMLALPFPSAGAVKIRSPSHSGTINCPQQPTYSVIPVPLVARSMVTVVDTNLLRPSVSSVADTCAGICPGPEGTWASSILITGPACISSLCDPSPYRDTTISFFAPLGSVLFCTLTTTSPSPVPVPADATKAFADTRRSLDPEPLAKYTSYPDTCVSSAARWMVMVPPMVPRSALVSVKVSPAGGEVGLMRSWASAEARVEDSPWLL
mmetsp:Transcript_36712/g.80225  ORF Transcript_36712/g.80225 Transcript_36712/m.80225 type:complete len:244 (-) Transcript_36712:319-1050(-)